MAAKYVTVKAGKVPGVIQNVVLSTRNCTAAAALKKAGVEAKAGFALRVNGAPAALDAKLADGDSAYLVRNAVGN